MASTELCLLPGLFIPKLLVRTSDSTIFSYSFLCFETLGMIPLQLIAYVCNLIDMALDLLESYPELAIAPDREGRSPVEVLAGMSFAYQSGNRLVYWKQWIYNSEYHSLFSISLLNYMLSCSHLGELIYECWFYI